MSPISLSKAMMSKWQHVCCDVTKQIPPLSYFHERSEVCIIKLWMCILQLDPSLQCPWTSIYLIITFVCHPSTKYAENTDHSGSLKLECHLSLSLYQRLHLLFLDMLPLRVRSVTILKEEGPLSNTSLSCIILYNVVR